MKNLIMVFLCLTLAIGVAGCNAKTDQKSSDPSSTKNKVAATTQQSAKGGQDLKDAFVGNWIVKEEISKDGEKRETGTLKVIYDVTPTEYKYYLGSAMSMRKRVTYTWAGDGKIDTETFVTSASMGEVSGGKESVGIEIKNGRLYMKTGDGKTTIMEKYTGDVPK